MNPKNAFYQANCTQGPIQTGRAPRMVRRSWLTRILWGDDENRAVIEPHEPVQLTGGDPRTIADEKE